MAILGSSAARLRTCLCTASTMRSFSTSEPALISFKKIFRKENSDLPGEISVQPTDVELAKREVVRSKSFNNYEKAALQSIIDKGVGKIVLAYQPPNNVKEKLQEIVQNIFSDQNAAEPLQIRFTDRARKFQFLTACESAFSHFVPNSQLFQLERTGDVLQFYLQPVEGTNGLTQYEKMDNLPPNLHINYQPSRFDPENDPIYGGLTAFPHSQNIITSLKFKKIYKSRRAQTNWPKVLDCAPFHRNLFPKPFTEHH